MGGTVVRRLYARWHGVRAPLTEPVHLDVPEDAMDTPTEGLPAAAPALCDAQHCAERARADALEARLDVLQRANMAADVAPAAFATEEVTTRA